MPNNQMKALKIGGTTYDIVDETSGYAKLASPTFTGTPTAPTPTSGDSSTKIATTAFVQDAMSGAGAGTVTSVGVSNATNGGLSVSGSPITGAGTITVGHSNVLSSAQTTSAVYPIKIDKNGHISEYGSAVTIPTKTSDLTNDSGFITVDEKVKTDLIPSTSATYYLTLSSSDSSQTSTLLKASELSAYYNSGSMLKLILGKDNIAGRIRLYSTGTTYAELGTNGSLAANRTLTIPDKTGTIALTSDIPTVPTNVSAFTNDAGYLTSYTETDPVFSASAAHGISASDITNWNGKQAALVSGTNIKTINNNSLLGSGNIDINDIFFAEYGVTTSAEIEAAYQANKAVFVIYQGFIGNLGSRINALNHLFVIVGLINTGYLTLRCTSDEWSLHPVNLQVSLESGTNIKTINNTSLLGSGNIATTLVQIVRW